MPEKSQLIPATGLLPTKVGRKAKGYDTDDTLTAVKH